MENKEQTTNKERTPMFKAIKDTLSLELTRPVITRLRNRLKALKNTTQAKHEKQMVGNRAIWHTTEPEVFISGLSASLENGVGIITYNRYEKDGKNKKIRVTKAISPISGKEVEVSAEYVLDCLVVETIQKNKALKVEEVRM